MLNPLWSMQMAMDWYKTALAAATTIGARTPILWSAALTGSPRAVRESQRMVSEKAQAAMAGASAAGWEAFRLWTNSAASLAMPSAAAWHKVAQAALRPARGTCRANARRLLGSPRRRRR